MAKKPAVVHFKNINLWSFIISLICISLLVVTAFLPILNIFGVHPLKVLLVVTLMNLCLGAIGFAGIRDWKTMLRSIITLVITLGLSIILSYVIFVGSLLT